MDVAASLKDGEIDPSAVVDAEIPIALAVRVPGRSRAAKNDGDDARSAPELRHELGDVGRAGAVGRHRSARLRRGSAPLCLSIEDGRANGESLAAGLPGLVPR